jgi:hypothetical protein
VIALLIDSTHKGWILVTGVLAIGTIALYLVVSWLTPGGLSGGSLIGLWYGLAAFGLMLYAATLSLLRRVPSWWWIGARKTWLRGHIWLGLLSVVLVVCHSGGRWGGPLEQILMALVYLTLATGVVGLALQQVLPRLITLRIPCEAPYEQIPYLCDATRRHADDVVAEGLAKPPTGHDDRTELSKFYRERVRPFLLRRYDRRSLLAHPLQAEDVFSRVRSSPGLAGYGGILDELKTCCDERRQLGEQERLHLWLHGWLLLHVPLSVALLLLSLAHAVMSLYY